MVVDERFWGCSGGTRRRSIWPSQNKAKPSPVPGPSTVTPTPGFSAWKSSATSALIGCTVDDPETVMVPDRSLSPVVVLSVSSPSASGPSAGSLPGPQAPANRAAATAALATAALATARERKGERIELSPQDGIGIWSVRTLRTSSLGRATERRTTAERLPTGPVRRDSLRPRSPAGRANGQDGARRAAHRACRTPDWARGLVGRHGVRSRAGC